MLLERAGGQSSRQRAQPKPEQRRTTPQTTYQTAACKLERQPHVHEGAEYFRTDAARLQRLAAQASGMNPTNTWSSSSIGTLKGNTVGNDSCRPYITPTLKPRHSFYKYNLKRVLLSDLRKQCTTTATRLRMEDMNSSLDTRPACQEQSNPNLSLSRSPCLSLSLSLKRHVLL